VSAPQIDLVELRASAQFVRSLMDGDQAGGFLDEFSAAIAPLATVAELAQRLLPEPGQTAVDADTLAELRAALEPFSAGAA